MRSGRGGSRRGREGPSAGAKEPPDPNDRSAAETAALRILQGASQSEAGMRRRLRARGFADEVVVEVTGRLVKGGWIDDKRMAISLAAKRREHGYGRRRVAADLAARGIADDATVDAALSSIDADAELLSARTVALRLRRRYPEGRLDSAQLRRFAAALQRRGFSTSTIRAVLREVDVSDQLGSATAD